MVDQFLKRCQRYSFEALSDSNVHSYVADYGGCKVVQNFGLNRAASLLTEKQWEILEQEHFRKTITMEIEAEIEKKKTGVPRSTG